ncbi:MAG: hypothetical protein ACI86X_002171, partial [Moritella sp.]
LLGAKPPRPCLNNEQNRGGFLRFKIDNKLTSYSGIYPNNSKLKSRDQLK